MTDKQRNVHKEKLCDYEICGKKHVTQRFDRIKKGEEFEKIVDKETGDLIGRGALNNMRCLGKCRAALFVSAENDCNKRDKLKCHVGGFCDNCVMCFPDIDNCDFALCGPCGKDPTLCRQFS